MVVPLSCFPPQLPPGAYVKRRGAIALDALTRWDRTTSTTVGSAQQGGKEEATALREACLLRNKPFFLFFYS